MRAVALVASIACLALSFSAFVGWGVALLTGTASLPAIAGAVVMTLVWVGVAVILEGF